VIERVRDPVLVENDAANAFYGARYERSGQRDVEIGGETHAATVYEGEIDRSTPGREPGEETGRYPPGADRVLEVSRSAW
jgi:hypothetical protein